MSVTGVVGRESCDRFLGHGSVEMDRLRLGF